MQQDSHDMQQMARFKVLGRCGQLRIYASKEFLAVRNPRTSLSSLQLDVNTRPVLEKGSHLQTNHDTRCSISVYYTEFELLGSSQARPPLLLAVAIQRASSRPWINWPAIWSWLRHRQDPTSPTSWLLAEASPTMRTLHLELVSFWMCATASKHGKHGGLRLWLWSSETFSDQN